MIGHIVISRGAAMNEVPDTVIIEYEPPHGQPVRLAVIEQAEPGADRRVIPIHVACKDDCDECDE